jgi:hypothetical protein
MKLRQILFAPVLAANALVAGSLWAAPPVPAAPAPASGPAVLAQPAADDDGPPRLSLPTESDRAVWKKPGFRFGLGLVYGRLFGINGPPNAQLIGPTIRLGIRLDERWSLMGSFQYLYATGTGGMRGTPAPSSPPGTRPSISISGWASALGAWSGLLPIGPIPIPSQAPWTRRTRFPMPGRRCQPATAWESLACCARNG